MPARLNGKNSGTHWLDWARYPRCGWPRSWHICCWNYCINSSSLPRWVPAPLITTTISPATTSPPKTDNRMPFLWMISLVLLREYLFACRRASISHPPTDSLTRAICFSILLLCGVGVHVQNVRAHKWCISISHTKHQHYYKAQMLCGSQYQCSNSAEMHERMRTTMYSINPTRLPRNGTWRAFAHLQGK